jgi:hypothetical protein
LSLLNNNKLQKVQLGMLADDVQQKFTDTATQLAQMSNDTSYTLGFLSGLNDIRTRAILSVNGFYSIDDGADGKYRVITVDGKVVTEYDNKVFTIKIEGDVADVNCDQSLTVVGNIKGKVESGGSVSCDSIEGNVSSKGSVNCDDISGDVQAGGSINCDKIGGNARAGGSINCF